MVNKLLTPAFGMLGEPMLHEYRERVLRAAEVRTGEPIYNGSLDHAAVLVETLFLCAREQVDVLSCELNARVYGRERVVEQVNLFLADRAHKARFLVEKKAALDWRNHPLLRALTDNDNVEFRSVPTWLLERYTFHMSLADGDCYRFEEDRTVPAAIAAFGDPSGAARLKSAFDGIWQNSTVIERPVVSDCAAVCA